jgi:hypothetical protein
MLWKIIWSFLKNLKVELPRNSAIPPLIHIHKKEEILVFATARMNLEDLMLADINQSQIDR